MGALMSEIIFIIEEDPDGGYNAHALGVSIITQADTLNELRENIREAVRCYYPDDSSRPKIKFA